MSGRARAERTADAAPVRRLTEQYVAFRDELVALAWRVTRDRDGAEDVVEEVLVKLLERIGRDEDREVGLGLGYFRRAVRHKALQSHRDLTKRRGAGWRAAVANERPPVPTPWDAFLDEHVRKVLNAAVEELPVSQRTALDLVDRRGLSCADAAERMGTTRHNVKQHLSRARRRLRAVLGSVGREFMDEV